MAKLDPRARAIAAAERAYARALEAEHAAGKVLDRQIAAAGAWSYANKKGGANRTALDRAEGKAEATNKALRALEAARAAAPSTPATAPRVSWQPGARPKARKPTSKRKAEPSGKELAPTPAERAHLKSFEAAIQSQELASTPADREARAPKRAAHAPTIEVAEHQAQLFAPPLPLTPRRQLDLFVERVRQLDFSQLLRGNK